MENSIYLNRVRREFSRRRTRQFAIHGITLGIVAAKLFGKHIGIWESVGLTSSEVLTVAIIAMAAALTVTLVNWRCPACTGYLGRNLFVDQCPKCGVRLL
jgi:hypothetical protein